MSKKTRLMSKLFSNDTPEEYKEIISERVDEALKNGTASYSEDGEDLTFQEMDGDVLVADESGDEVEVTRMSPNPEDENDMIMTPEEDVEVIDTEKTKTESEDQNLKSVEISVLPGEGEAKEADLVDDLKIEVDPDVEGTQRYSMRFKNFSEKKAKMLSKIFCESVHALKEMCDCDVDEDVQVKFTGDKMKVMSLTVGKKSRTFSENEEAETSEVENAANALIDTVENEGITPENADVIKQEADELLVNLEKMECYSQKKSLTALMKLYSEAAEEAKVENPTEAPTEEPTAEPTAEPTEAPTEEPTAEPTEAPTEEPTPAPAAGTKTESEPSVTVTIENLEPASVADLLGVKEEKEGEPAADTEPKVDPNESDFSSKAFSMKKAASESVNPYLTTKIY